MKRSVVAALLSTSHTWRVLEHIYRGGAHLSETSASVDATCTV